MTFLVKPMAETRWQSIWAVIRAAHVCSPQPLGFLSRELDREQTRSLAANVARACGFPGLSMALLASVFRAGQQTGLAQPAGARLTTGIGLDLGLRGAGEPLFDNLSSVVPIVAQSDQLLCRRELTQALNAQLRDRLQRRIDLGVIALSDLFRHRRGIVGYAMSRLMRGGYSVWYAYFGSGDAIGDAFFDVPIEDFTSFGPCWPSIGLTVIASEFRQRMQLQCTYVAGGVSHLAAETFMDALVRDLDGGEREDS